MRSSPHPAYAFQVSGPRLRPSVGSNSYVTASLGPIHESDPSGSHCSTGKWIGLGFSLCLSLRSGLWCWGGGCCFVGRLVRSRTRLSHVTCSSSKGPARFVLRTRRPLTTRARSRLHPRLRFARILIAGGWRLSVLICTLVLRTRTWVP